MDGWVGEKRPAVRWQVSARVRRDFNAPRELSGTRFAPELAG